MILSPNLQGADHRPQRPTFRRKGVLHLRRHFWINRSRDEGGFFEFPQLFGEHPLRDFLETTAQLVKSQGFLSRW
jgi:hypothetical protein